MGFHCRNVSGRKWETVMAIIHKWGKLDTTEILKRREQKFYKRTRKKLLKGGCQDTYSNSRGDREKSGIFWLHHACDNSLSFCSHLSGVARQKLFLKKCKPKFLLIIRQQMVWNQGRTFYLLFFIFLFKVIKTNKIYTSVEIN